MDINTFIILNGKILPANQPVLTLENRSFRYGDAIFETIRYRKGVPLYFNNHISRLLNGMAILKMSTKSLPSTTQLKEQISSITVKNRIFNDARIRLTVFRNDGGLYTPANNDVSYTIEASPIKNEIFVSSKKGLLIDVYNKHKKAISPLHNFKNANSILYVLAGIHKKELQLDDCLIVNEDNKIIEGLSSNLFWIAEKTVYTPLLSTGCVDGIMRKQVIDAIKISGISLKEVEGTSINELLNADEIFLTNVIQGIRWVMGLRNKRFYNITTKEITELLKKASN